MKHFYQIFLLVFGFYFIPSNEVKAQKIVPHNKLKTPTFIEYSHPLPAFENWKKIVSNLGGYNQEVDWKIYNELNDDLGQKHSRIQMYVSGIPVYYGMAILHSQRGTLFRINGNLMPQKWVGGKHFFPKKLVVS